MKYQLSSALLVLATLAFSVQAQVKPPTEDLCCPGYTGKIEEDPFNLPIHRKDARRTCRAPLTSDEQFNYAVCDYNKFGYPFDNRQQCKPLKPCAK